MFNASMQFDLGDEVNALRDMVHRWAQDRVKPMAQEIDQKNEFPPELWAEMGELGLVASLRRRLRLTRKVKAETSNGTIIIAMAS